MSKSFIYKGKTFHPGRKIDGVFGYFQYYLTVHKGTVSFEFSKTTDGYDYDDFYDAARKAGCGDYDTFFMTDVSDAEFLPCKCELFRLKRNVV